MAIKLKSHLDGLDVAQELVMSMLAFVRIPMSVSIPHLNIKFVQMVVTQHALPQDFKTNIVLREHPRLSCQEVVAV